jgi:leukotriene-A4 hydrolase
MLPNLNLSFNLLLFFGLLVFSLSACQNKPDSMKKNMIWPDPHSYANFNDIQIKHLDLLLEVDFKSQMLIGEATLHLNYLTKTDTLVLDGSDLAVSEVVDNNGKRLLFGISNPSAVKGQRIAIVLGDKSPAKVTIKYQTSPQAAALQWTPAGQTAGKKHPFLFSQSQAILARSWVPLQDCPSVRFTYSATVKTDSNLLVVMSANNPVEKNGTGKYTFSMPIAIPSYLMAIAVGDLAFLPISERCGIYAEPSSIEKAKSEFIDLEKMVVCAESLFGPYRWGRYDLLVLPPSFPFGGMENPKLTFLTPSVIVGDRSLTSLVAHELAHSWSGNLVTNASWNDFWLNEGFTVYCERRIMEKLYGSDVAEMLEVLGYQDLKSELNDLKDHPRDTWLHLDLNERNPDDGMNDIAYEKGYFFLKYIERTIGRNAFDTFLNEYFDRFAFQSVSTNDFEKYVLEVICKENKARFDSLKLNDWILAPGLPDTFKEPASVLLSKAEKDAELFCFGKLDEKALRAYHPFQHIRFLQAVGGRLDTLGFDRLEELYPYSDTENPEILTAWLIEVLPLGYQKAFYPAQRLLKNTGRRKFLVPVYKSLMNSDKGRLVAILTYKEARNSYHSVASSTLDRLLYP